MDELAKIELVDWLTMLVIFAGPYLGIYLYGKVEDRKKADQRKHDIFKSLMATRAAVLSPEHVRALNSIDIEFTASGEQKVRDAWTAYLQHLNNALQMPPAPPPNATSAEQEAYAAAYQQYQNDDNEWTRDARDRLATLLMEMSKLFGYDFDQGRIHKAAYRPRRHADIEEAQLYLLHMMGAVFGGRGVLPMLVTNWPPPTEGQQALAEGITKALDEGVPIRTLDGA